MLVLHILFMIIYKEINKLWYKMTWIKNHAMNQEQSDKISDQLGSTLTTHASSRFYLIGWLDN